MVPSRALDRAKQFLFRHFERLFVLLLVASLVGINVAVDDKVAFLSFYYLPIILAGFWGGRRFATVSALFIVLLVFYYQAVVGLGIDWLPGLYTGVLVTLVPWAGFLILTGYAVGALAEDRRRRAEDIRMAYLATLEILTFHIESAEQHQQGHSHRVSIVAEAIAKELKLAEEDAQNLRIAGLLHEVGTRDQRLLKLLSRAATDETVPIARVMHGAAAIIAEYGSYYEVVGEEWELDALPISPAVKILAVADAFETLQTATPVRPAFAKWTALEEVEKGAGKTFWREAVRALRVVAGRPETMTGTTQELRVV